MNIHAQTTTEILRLYEEGSYEQKSKYCAVLTIIHESDDLVSIHGFHGKINKSLHSKIYEYLKSIGKIYIRRFRHGKWETIKIP